MITKERFQELLFYLGSNTQNITSLNLSFEVFGDEGVNGLAGVLSHNQTLIGLDLSSVNMTTVGAMNLANALPHNHHLQYLSLACNPIEDVGAATLFSALREQNSIETLSLLQTNLSDKIVPSLAHCLQHNHCLKSLNLDNNNLSNAGLRIIAEALKTNFTLTQLHFRHNTGINKDANFVIAEIKYLLKRNKKIDRIQQDLQTTLNYIQSLDNNMLNKQSNFNAKNHEKDYFTILQDIENQMVNGINELQDVGFPGATHLMDRWYLFCATGYPKVNRITQTKLLEEVAQHQDSPYRLDAIRLLGQMYFIKMRSDGEDIIQQALKSHVYLKHADHSLEFSQGVLKSILGELDRNTTHMEISDHKKAFNPEYFNALEQVQTILKTEDSKLTTAHPPPKNTRPKRMTYLFDQSKTRFNHHEVDMETDALQMTNQIEEDKEKSSLGRM